MSLSREPVKWLNYRGDVRATFDEGRGYGPNLLGELLYPVDAEYDPATDMTRVGFSPIHPAAVAS